MTTATRRRPMTDIRPAITGATIIGNPNRGPIRFRRERWAAESEARVPGTDRPLWTYTRIEQPGTPWVVAYGPTGQETFDGSLTSARRWTATPGAVPYLRHQAATVVAAGGRSDAIVMHRVNGTLRRVAEDPLAVAERLAAAQRHVAIIDGLMLPAGGDNEPEARCVCAGYLAWRAARWIHVDACADCWARGDGWTTDPLPCHDPFGGHAVCATPEPEQCEHYRCIAAGSLTAWPCGADREQCCGCCHGEG